MIRLLFSSCLLAVFSITIADDLPSTVENEKISDGEFSFFDGSGKGACGRENDRTTTPLVAISKEYFTSLENLNNDPVCKDVCVEVTYKGKCIKVPVEDQCPECPKNKLDLSKAAFLKLEPDLKVGIAKKVSWVFVKCDGSETCSGGGSQGFFQNIFSFFQNIFQDVFKKIGNIVG